MSYNYQREIERLWKEQEKLIEECEKAGMAGEAVGMILEYDMEQFRSDRAFYMHSLSADFDADCSDEDADDAGRILRQYADAFAAEDEPFSDSYEDQLQMFQDRKLYDGLQGLTALQKKIWELYAVMGYTEKEIGEMLGIAQQTVSRHILRIRKKLKKFLK